MPGVAPSLETARLPCGNRGRRDRRWWRRLWRRKRKPRPKAHDQHADKRRRHPQQLSTARERASDGAVAAAVGTVRRHVARKMHEAIHAQDAGVSREIAGFVRLHGMNDGHPLRRWQCRTARRTTRTRGPFTKFSNTPQATRSHQPGDPPLLLAARRQVMAASQNEKSCANSGTEELHSMKLRRVKGCAGRIVPTTDSPERIS
jgi:hypothetical protein